MWGMEGGKIYFLLRNHWNTPMYKIKERRKSFCFLFKQIVRKWETFWTNYICFLTPPPPPPLLLFLYGKGKWPLQEQTAVSFRCGYTHSDSRAAPPRTVLIRKWGLRACRRAKPRIQQCFSWTRLVRHMSTQTCPQPSPLAPCCPLSPGLSTHGKATLTCWYKMWAFAFLVSISIALKCRSTWALDRGGRQTATG